MKRLTIGLIALTAMLIATSAIADEKQDAVKVTLSVPQIVDLNVVEEAVTVVPGPEDYATKMDNGLNSVVGPAGHFPEEDYGFADRADALSVNLFTNARKGAKLFVHALANPAHDKSLRVQDVYLTVMTEKTYVLLNKLEDAAATAQTVDGSGPTPRASWLQLDNEAQELFSVGKATKATRLVVLKLGIGNLARYTENVEGYEADLTFTLMPTVI